MVSQLLVEDKIKLKTSCLLYSEPQIINVNIRNFTENPIIQTALKENFKFASTWTIHKL